MLSPVEIFNLLSLYPEPRRAIKMREFSCQENSDGGICGRELSAINFEDYGCTRDPGVDAAQLEYLIMITNDLANRIALKCDGDTEKSLQSIISRDDKVGWLPAGQLTTSTKGIKRFDVSKPYRYLMEGFWPTAHGSPGGNVIWETGKPLSFSMFQYTDPYKVKVMVPTQWYIYKDYGTLQGIYARVGQAYDPH